MDYLFLLLQLFCNFIAAVAATAFRLNLCTLSRAGYNVSFLQVPEYILYDLFTERFPVVWLTGEHKQWPQIDTTPI